MSEVPREDVEPVTMADAAVEAESVRPEDVPAQEYHLQVIEARTVLYAEVLNLPETWAVVVILHLGLGDERAHTFAEIGARFGYSSSRAHKVFEQACARLRAPEVIERLKVAGVPDVFGVRA